MVTPDESVLPTVRSENPASGATVISYLLLIATLPIPFTVDIGAVGWMLPLIAIIAIFFCNALWGVVREGNRQVIDKATRRIIRILRDEHGIHVIGNRDLVVPDGTIQKARVPESDIPARNLDGEMILLNISVDPTETTVTPYNIRKVENICGSSSCPADSRT